jgi:hypothetical protein
MSRVNGPRRRVVPRLPVHYFGEKPYSRRTRLFSFGVPFAGCFPARPRRETAITVRTAQSIGDLLAAIYITFPIAQKRTPFDVPGAPSLARTPPDLVTGCVAPPGGEINKRD